MYWIMGDLYSLLYIAGFAWESPQSLSVILMQLWAKFSFTLKSDPVGMLNYTVALSIG